MGRAPRRPPGWFSEPTLEAHPGEDGDDGVGIGREHAEDGAAWVGAWGEHPGGEDGDGGVGRGREHAEDGAARARTCEPEEAILARTAMKGLWGDGSPREKSWRGWARGASTPTAARLVFGANLRRPSKARTVFSF